MLTDQQTAHFETFGFVIFRQLFNPTEMRTIRGEFKQGLTATKRHSSPDEPNKYVNWSNLGPQTPFLSQLMEDPRINGVAEHLFGDDAIGISCNSGSFVNETDWHPDNQDIHMRSVRFAIYFQPLHGDNGALRLVPGSHKNPLHDELTGVIRGLGIGGVDVPAYACRSEPGDVVVFDQRLWHSSWGGSTDRRMVTIQFYKNPQTPEERKAVEGMVAIDAQIRRELAQNTFDETRPEYDPHWVSNPDGSPRRQRWIDWLRHWGYLSSTSN
jgi:ectoine hydroxylase-related dioxygenase (phytanoyl-CoA dioxygenase family)